MNLRDRITDALIEHQRLDIGMCRCGWGVNTGHLGHSHAAHQADAVVDVLGAVAFTVDVGGQT